MTSDRLSTYLERLDASNPLQVVGRVRAVTGLAIRANAAGARIGELVSISRAGPELLAEVVGMRDDQVTLLPLGDLRGVGPDSEVRALGQSLRVQVGPHLLGRVLDGLGDPIDGGSAPPTDTETRWEIVRAAPNPMARRRIEKPLSLGVRSIDALLTLGEGQRIGLFSGAGVGKSRLLGQIARQTEADVVVICLVGERGREVRSFVEDALGDGLRRSVVVVATSDEPPLKRLKSAYTATAIAEFFRERGDRVLLMMDSLTRFARAQRDVGLAAGELPARHGYPPSVFTALPTLLERAGNSANGAMTAIYTVLVAGDDLSEPIADEVRGLLDGHVVLSRRLAEAGHYPAVDVLASLSRVMDRVVSPEHLAASRRFRERLAVWESKRELITLGAYTAGSDPEVDHAIEVIDDYRQFLRQGLDEHADWSGTVDELLDVADL